MRQISIGNANVEIYDNDAHEFRNALCKYTDPETFFPDERKLKNPENSQKIKLAKSICGDCEHEIECAAYAIVNPELEGVWGGTTFADRKKIRKRLGINERSKSNIDNDSDNTIH